MSERRPFVVGNWKMNLNLASSVELAEGLAKQTAEISDVDVGVCPPFVHLLAVCKAASGSMVVGAQNMHPEPKGAFTGDISGEMLVDIGCSHVILGHSERRHKFGESDDFIHEKVLAALRCGLNLILCVGELLEEREAEKTQDVVGRQLKIGLNDLSAEDMKKVTIAYEPVWAIGTGKVATPDQAEEVHRMIRDFLRSAFDKTVAENTRIQYGGSVTPDNVEGLIAQPDIDGALVGGASLKLNDFMGIVQKCSNLKSPVG